MKVKELSFIISKVGHVSLNLELFDGRFSDKGHFYHMTVVHRIIITCELIWTIDLED